MAKKEYDRIPLEELAGEFACLECGKKFYLYANGGEGDSKDCCGFTYTNRAARFELMIEKEIGDAAKA